MYARCFLLGRQAVKVYKKVVKFSFKQQKIFWVLVFSFIYLVLVDAMDESFIADFLNLQNHGHFLDTFYSIIFFSILQVFNIFLHAYFAWN